MNNDSMKLYTAVNKKNDYAVVKCNACPKSVAKNF